MHVYIFTSPHTYHTHMCMYGGLKVMSDLCLSFSTFIVLVQRLFEPRAGEIGSVVSPRDPPSSTSVERGFYAASSSFLHRVLGI